jgi:5-methylcytosine-specific restriction protein A
VVKRSPLTRKTPLAATKGMSPARELKRGETKPRPPRNTGPTPAVRRTIAERAAGACERCGKTITGAYSVHHRKPRGMGGTRDPQANSPSNLVMLCGSATTPDGCHTAVERFRQSAVTTGFIVNRAADPETVPIKLATGWCFLRPDGTKLPTIRPETPLDDE